MAPIPLPFYYLLVSKRNLLSTQRWWLVYSFYYLFAYGYFSFHSKSDFEVFTHRICVCHVCDHIQFEGLKEYSNVTQRALSNVSCTWYRPLWIWHGWKHDVICWKWIRCKVPFLKTVYVSYINRKRCWTCSRIQQNCEKATQSSTHACVMAWRSRTPLFHYFLYIVTFCFYRFLLHIFPFRHIIYPLFSVFA